MSRGLRKIKPVEVSPMRGSGWGLTLQAWLAMPIEVRFFDSPDTARERRKITLVVQFQKIHLSRLIYDLGYKEGFALIKISHIHTWM